MSTGSGRGSLAAKDMAEGMAEASRVEEDGR